MQISLIEIKLHSNLIRITTPLILDIKREYTAKN